MAILASEPPHDVVFLRAVRCAGEKLPRRKARLLYCDADGYIMTSKMSRSAYEFARQAAMLTAGNQHPSATIGLETIADRFIPVTVSIGAPEVRALDGISKRAARQGRLPDSLKKHIVAMIGAVRANHEAVVPCRQQRRRSKPEVTPELLEKFPRHPEHDIEIMLPLYKAAYRYPLVVLEILLPDAQTLPDALRLLVLDGESDLAIIRVPARLRRRIDLPYRERAVAVLLSGQKKGFQTAYLPVNRHQRESLDILIRYFKNTGRSKRPLSLNVASVIARAKDRAASLPV